MGGIYLGDPLFDTVMEEWNRRKALVIIHPCRARKRPENVITGTVSAIYEYPADTTRAVLNMIANKIQPDPGFSDDNNYLKNAFAEAEHVDFHNGLEKHEVITADGRNITDMVEKAVSWLTENSF